MRILVLGATGGIGIEIVRQAVERGHAVTVFVRLRGSLSPFVGRMSILEGDLLDAAQLKSAVAGHDAVLSAFGPRLPIAKSDARLLSNFASALVPAMQLAQVQRAIVVSTAFLFKNALIPYVFGRIFFRGVVADATGMETTLTASGLDVTIVRPPELTNKSHTGRFRVCEGHLPRFGLSIPRTDVADFMLQVAEHDLFPRAVVGIAT